MTAYCFCGWETGLANHPTGWCPFKPARSSAGPAKRVRSNLWGHPCCSTICVTNLETVDPAASMSTAHSTQAPLLL